MNKNYIEKEKNLFLQTYNRFPFVIKSAKGNRIFDTNGTEYHDFIAGIGVNLLGHSHPRIIEATVQQIEKYMHVSNYFYQEAQIKFAEKLLEISRFSRLFLANSGAEANEGAIKLCRSWGFEQNKTEIIAFSGGFHGRTYGALSLMDKPKYKHRMGPWLDGIKVVEFSNSRALEATVSDKTAGIFLEFIQGEGGLSQVSDEFIATVKRLRKKFNFLLIADEVQSGTGRTGAFLAAEYWNIEPDIATVAKGIGGGLPLGAILVQAHLADVWQAGNHGSTFGGNPVACAAGLVVLNELQSGILNNVRKVGDYFLAELQKLQNDFPATVKELRGFGLMRGIVFDFATVKQKFDVSQLVQKLFLEKRIISNVVSGNVLRIIPPLIITFADVDEFIFALRACLSKI